MGKREIITLMHKLHYGDINTSDGYVHLMVNGSLDREKFEQFVRRYITEDNLLLYADSQNVMWGGIQEAFAFTQEHMLSNRIRVASMDFLAKLIIEPTGVGAGHLASG